jgi:hypothetical protein
MSFRFGSWLRGLAARLTGRRSGSTGKPRRQKGKRRLQFQKPDLEVLGPRLAPASGVMSFTPGALFIDMCQARQTVVNALKSYRLVYEMVTNFKVLPLNTQKKRAPHVTTLVVPVRPERRAGACPPLASNSN